MDLWMMRPPVIFGKNPAFTHRDAAAAGARE